MNIQRIRRPWIKAYSTDKVHDKWYDSTQWRHKRKEILIRDRSLCQYCKRKEQITIGNTVDHTLPRRIFPELEWQDTNLKTICKPCDQTKRALEKQCETKDDCYTVLKEYL